MGIEGVVQVQLNVDKLPAYSSGPATVMRLGVQTECGQSIFGCVPAHPRVTNWYLAYLSTKRRPLTLIALVMAGRWCAGKGQV